jgi:hypothetical protein
MVRLRPGRFSVHSKAKCGGCDQFALSQHGLIGVGRGRLWLVLFIRGVVVWGEGREWWWTAPKRSRVLRGRGVCERLKRSELRPGESSFELSKGDYNAEKIITQMS